MAASAQAARTLYAAEATSETTPKRVRWPPSKRALPVAEIGASLLAQSLTPRFRHYTRS